MNLPDLSKVEIPKRIASAIVGMYIIKEVSNLQMAIIIAAVLCVGIIAQTITDVKGKKQAPK